MMYAARLYDADGSEFDDLRGCHDSAKGADMTCGTER